MSQKAAYHRVSQRVAEEAQLLAEEKWIIEALTKIRKQRNSLQIERLHLESLRSQLKVDENAQKELEVPSSTAAVDFMKTLPSIVPSSVEIEVLPSTVSDVEAVCNEEELNLSVTHSVFLKEPDPMTCNMEEEDDEDDDMFIDMNMFMNGDTSRGKQRTAQDECD